MARVEVDRHVLQWAIDRSGEPVDQLRKKPPLRKLEEWLEGTRSPTLKQLEHLSRATLTPLGLLMLPEPPEEQLPIPDYRTLPDTDLRHPSPELLQTIYTMQRRQNWMRDYLQDMGCDELEFVNSSDTVDRDAKETAKKLRSILGLDELWAQSLKSWSHALRYLKNAMEDARIIVVFNSILGNNTHRKLDVEEFRGFVLLDEHAPFVFVNSADSKAAQMFTLAHEMAHIVFGTSGVFNLRNLQPFDDPTERACNEIAAEFLVPGKELLSSWSDVGQTPNRLELLARQFRVSEIVTARRALDMDLLSMDEFMEFYRDYQDRVRRSEERQRDAKAGGPSFYTMQNYRIGLPFARAVYRAVREGNLLYSDAYKLTGLRRKTFDEYMKRIQ